MKVKKETFEIRCHLVYFKNLSFQDAPSPLECPFRAPGWSQISWFLCGQQWGFCNGLFILFRLPGTRTGRVVWDNLFVYWKPFHKLCSDVAIKDAILKRSKISGRLIPSCLPDILAIVKTPNPFNRLTSYYVIDNNKHTYTTPICI